MAYQPAVSREDFKHVAFFDTNATLHCDTSIPGWSRVNRPRLSPSLTTSLGGCLAKLVADKLIPWPSTPFDPAPLGTSTHAALEDFYGLAPHERTLANFHAIVANLDRSTHAQRNKIDVPEMDRIPDWKEAVWNLGRRELEMNDPTSIVVVDREIRVEATIGGVPFKGFVDRLQADPCGGVRVVDYKTGKFPDPEKLRRFGDPASRQQVDYALGLEAQGYQVASAGLHYTGSGQIKEVSLSEEARQQSLTTMQEAWSTLQVLGTQGTAPTQPSGLCSYCLLAQVCPASRAIPARLSPEALISGELGVETRRTVEPSQPTKDQAMMNTPPRSNLIISVEDKPFVEFITGNHPETNEVVSALQLNSYAASSVCGLVTWATELISQHGNPTLKGSGVQITALTQTLLRIEMNALNAVGISEYSFQSGASTRIRGMLRSRVEAVPPPFGQDRAAWDEWVSLMTRNVASMLKVAVNTWAGGAQETPWSVLAPEAASAEKPSDPAPQS